MKTTSFNVLHLSWPILIEQLLFQMMGTADTFMLSHISSTAVAAVGAGNQVVSIVLMIFNMVSGATTVLVAQYRGAGREGECAAYSAGAITVNLWFGLFISLLVLIFRSVIGSWLQLPTMVLRDTDAYLGIVGSTLFIQALLGTVSSVLRTNGFTRETMMISIGMNAIHICGNYLFIFGALGVPKLGVVGVSISTSVSRLLALVVMFSLMNHLVPYRMAWHNYVHIGWNRLRQIFSIGIPAAGEPLAYQISQVAMTSFMAMYGASVLATRVYTMNIMGFISVFGMALGIATQIVVGHLVGAGKSMDAYRQGWQVLRIAFSIAAVVSITIALLGHWMFHMFTSDPNVVWMGTHLLLICILLEPGRTFNLVMVQALRAAGDVNYPVILGIIFPFMLGVPFSYYLGVHLHMGLFGVWWTICLDEWIRGMLNIARWRSRHWEKKVIAQSTIETTYET